MLQR
ncbi:hypothetical protein HaLaN_26800, partial [Haematococcus lacustris]|jgi:hypothetical protein